MLSSRWVAKGIYHKNVDNITRHVGLTRNPGEDARARRPMTASAFYAIYAPKAATLESPAGAIALILEDRRKDGLRGVPATAIREKVVAIARRYRETNT